MESAQNFDLIKWLFDNSIMLGQLFVGLLTAFATFALWNVTRVLAVETKTLAKMTSQPFVVCWMESSLASSVALDLKLMNTGNATAFDIKMELSPGLPDKIGMDGPKPEDGSTFIFDSSVLPPSKEQRIRGVMSPQVDEVSFDVTISWARFPKSSDRESVAYSFTARDGFRGGFGAKGLHQVVGELEKIANRLK